MDGTFWGCSCEYLINYWHFGCNITFEEERKTKPQPLTNVLEGKIQYYIGIVSWESLQILCVWINGALCMGQLWWLNQLLNSRGIILYYSTVSNGILRDVTVFNSILSWWCVRKVVRGSRKHLQRNSHVINVAPLFFSLPQALFLLLLLLRANLQHAGDINRHLWAFD